MSQTSGAGPVLIVEDNASIRQDLASLVEELGRQVVTAENGLDALERLRWGLKPRLILLDLRMPVMTGWEFRTEQKKDPKLSVFPVVAMTTGNWRTGDLNDFAERIDKPIRMAQLVEVLDRYCPVVPGRWTPTPAKRASASQPSTMVLLVDDNADIRLAVRETLEHEGFQVRTAGDGRDALEVIEKEGRPCLILLDLAMPVMDGWQFLAARRTQPSLRDIPIVVLSAVAKHAGGNLDGVAAILHKPVEPARLIQVVRACCADRQSA